MQEFHMRGLRYGGMGVKGIPHTIPQPTVCVDRTGFMKQHQNEKEYHKDTKLTQKERERKRDGKHKKEGEKGKKR